MEIGVIVGALIFFFIIVPTAFPKTYKRMLDAVTRWTDSDDSKPKTQARPDAGDNQSRSDGA